jgi:hypothetical protein
MMLYSHIGLEPGFGFVQNVIEDGCGSGDTDAGYLPLDTERRPMLNPDDFLCYGLGGIPILESEHCLDEVTRTRARTWRERLLSWPWRPWIGETTYVTLVPSKHVYMLQNPPCIICHPVTAKEIRARIAT